jgi:hypothetical protein
MLFINNVFKMSSSEPRKYSVVGKSELEGISFPFFLKLARCLTTDNTLKKKKKKKKKLARLQHL